MKPYRGTLLTAAVLLAALSLSGCGEAGDWKKTTEITLRANSTSVIVKDEVIFTVQSPPPALTDGYQCETVLEYRAEGSVEVSWRSVPGTGPTRIFSISPRIVEPFSVMARGMCAGAKEDWKYSNQVDVTVTEAPAPPAPTLPTVTSVTLSSTTASPVTHPATINYTLAATKSVDCTLVLKRGHEGTALALFTANPTAAGDWSAATIGAGTAKITASGWCTENPSAIVIATPLDFTVE